MKFGRNVTGDRLYLDDVAGALFTVWCKQPDALGMLPLGPEATWAGVLSRRPDLAARWRDVAGQALTIGKPLAHLPTIEVAELLFSAWMRIATKAGPLLTWAEVLKRWPSVVIAWSEIAVEAQALASRFAPSAVTYRAVLVDNATGETLAATEGIPARPRAGGGT